MYQSDFDKAVEFYNAGRYLEAHEFNKKVLLKDPNNVSALSNSACIEDELGNLTKAFDDINRAIQLDRKRADSYYNRAFLYLYKKCEYELALQDYTKAIALGARKIEKAYSSRGYCYEKLKMWNNALEDYSRAIDLDPKDHWSHCGRARMYVENEAYELAYDDYINFTKLRYPEYNSRELITIVESDHLNKGGGIYGTVNKNKTGF